MKGGDVAPFKGRAQGMHGSAVCKCEAGCHTHPNASFPKACASDSIRIVCLEVTARLFLWVCILCSVYFAPRDGHQDPRGADAIAIHAFGLLVPL